MPHLICISVMTERLLLVWCSDEWITVCLAVTVALLLNVLIFFLTGCIPFWVASGSMCSPVNMKHPCWRWQLNLTVHILLVLCYLPWHKWESKGWVEGHAVRPARDLGLAQRDGNWDTLRWPICTNPRASANNPLSWLHPSSAFSKVSPQTRLLKPFVTQRSVHWETRANTKSQCLLSWGECNSRIPRVGISDRQSNSTQYLLSVGLLGLPSQHTCMSCREVYMEVH